MNFKRFKKNLPDAYQELEYIQSGSLYLQTGYIDTGLVGTDLYGCEIETCMKVTAITNSNLYYLNGAYVSGQTTQIGLIREDTEYVHSVANMGFNVVSYSGSIALSDWHTIYTSDGIQKTDDIIISNETYGTFNNLRYLLFARRDTDVTLSPPFAMKYFWVKKNGQYIRNMIPAKRKSDNVVGMYDIANDVFYTSENQYIFIGGSDVAPVWHDTPHYIHNTSTDTITTLPVDLYADGTNATVGISGNMEQSGTPTPQNPIQPSECGDLETVGEKAGQYKIPISSGDTTTPVYLGEVQTTRKIGKIDLSEVSWTMLASGLWRTMDIPNIKYVSANTEIGGGIAEKYTIHTGAGMISALNCIAIDVSQVSVNTGSNTETPTGMFWYVLATETTGIVNEPLMKIGDYADTVSSITVPMITGANSFDVLTTLKPSEVTVNYHGWHPVQSVHEYDSNYTIATMQALTIAQLQSHTIGDLEGGEWA